MQVLPLKPLDTAWRFRYLLDIFVPWLPLDVFPSLTQGYCQRPKKDCPKAKNFMTEGQSPLLELEVSPLFSRSVFTFISSMFYNLSP